MTVKPVKAAINKNLLRDIRDLIEQTRSAVAATVNAGLTMLNWHIGQRIHVEILQGKRAGYGDEIVSTLSRQLVAEYGNGFSSKNLRHMVRFAEAYPDESIVSTLWRQLGWSHFKEIIYINDSLKRDFYAEMCRMERWSVRTLRDKIGGMLYERTAISRKPESVIRHELDNLRSDDQITPDLVFKDPYISIFWA
jgi:hypothetical protein